MEFVAPIFLAGLGALIAPYLLHRLNQQIAPVRDFPSTRFLEQTTDISARQRRLRYLRLLLLRLLMLGVLCLLFAEPLLRMAGGGSGDSRALHLISVDTSFSMRAGERWVNAQQQAKDVISDLPVGAQAALYSAQAGLTTVVELTADRDQLLAGVESMLPGFAATDYSRMMQQLDQVAERQRLPTIVHLITDAQQSQLPARVNELLVEHVDGFRIYPVVKDESNAGNYAVDAELIAAEDEFQVSATVLYFATGQPTESVDLQLTDQSGDVSQQRLDADDFSADGAGRWRAEFVFDARRWPESDSIQRYRVGIDAQDALSDDDVLEIPVHRKLRSQVLVLDDGTPSSRDDSWFYINTALELERSVVAIAKRAENAPIPGDTSFVIYLDNRDRESAGLPSLPAALNDYLEQGGAVLYVLGGRDLSQSSSAAFDSVFVDWVDSSHPLALADLDWQDVRFYAADKLSTDNERERVLVQSSDGNPVLLETQHESGHLLWLNASLDGSRNNLPISPVFVPFLHNITHYYLNRNQYPQRLQVGENVKLPPSVQLLDPQGVALLDLQQSQAGSVHLANRPGVHTILDQQGEHAMNVLVDTIESDTVAAESEQLQAWLDLWAEPDESARSGEAESAGLVQTGDDADAPLNRVALVQWLLPLCVLLFLAEAFYANLHLRVRRS